MLRMRDTGPRTEASANRILEAGAADLPEHHSLTDYFGDITWSGGLCVHSLLHEHSEGGL